MKKILVVDEMTNGLPLSRLLHADEHACEIALNSKEGLVLLGEEGNGFDLILMDQDAGGVNAGMRFAAIVAKRFPQIKFILMSGGGRPQSYKGQFLAKPISRAQLQEAVRLASEQ